MLYLSLLHLSVDHPRWSQLDPYHAHQIVWKAYPGHTGGDRPFLFSLDRYGSHYSLLVQSSVPPDWSFLEDDADVSQKSVNPEQVPTGTSLRFFLRANPTVDRKGYPDGKTRRVAVGTNPELVFKQMGSPEKTPMEPSAVARWRDKELKAWLQRHGQRSGFRIVEDEVITGPIVSRKIVRTENGRPKGRPMIFHEVEFTGLLQVEDMDAFKDAWSGGIGRGKAFGYGMLMIRPA